MDFNEYTNSPVYRTANEASFFLCEHSFEFSDVKKMCYLEELKKCNVYAQCTAPLCNVYLCIL